MRGCWRSCSRPGQCFLLRHAHCWATSDTCRRLAAGALGMAQPGRALLSTLLVPPDLAANCAHLWAPLVRSGSAGRGQAGAHDAVHPAVSCGALLPHRSQAHLAVCRRASQVGSQRQLQPGCVFRLLHCAPAVARCLRKLALFWQLSCSATDACAGLAMQAKRRPQCQPAAPLPATAGAPGLVARETAKWAATTRPLSTRRRVSEFISLLHLRLDPGSVLILAGLCLGLCRRACSCCVRRLQQLGAQACSCCERAALPCWVGTHRSQQSLVVVRAASLGGQDP